MPCCLRNDVPRATRRFACLRASLIVVGLLDIGSAQFACTLRAELVSVSMNTFSDPLQTSLRRLVVYGPLSNGSTNAVDVLLARDTPSTARADGGSATNKATAVVRAEVTDALTRRERRLRQSDCCCSRGRTLVKIAIMIIVVIVVERVRRGFRCYKGRSRRNCHIYTFIHLYIYTLLSLLFLLFNAFSSCVPANSFASVPSMNTSSFLRRQQHNQQQQPVHAAAALKRPAAKTTVPVTLPLPLSSLVSSAKVGL